MIRQFFVMLWHQNRKYFAIAVEMAFVFIILLWSMTSLFNTVKKYHSPGLLDTENVVILGCVETGAYYRLKGYKPFPFLNNIMEKIKTKDYVEAVVEGLNFIPYISTESNINWRISIGNGEKFFCPLRAVDGDVEGVYKPNLIEGKWFVDGELTEHGNRPVVVNQQFVEKHKLENPIGTLINLESNKFEIVGVLDGYKSDPINESKHTVIFPLNGFFLQKGCKAWREFGVRVKPGYEETLINDFYREFKVARNGKYADVIPLIYDSSTLKSGIMKDAITEISFVGIPAVFLFLFTLLGMVGVNLMDVKSRMREFALRISVGATVKKIAFMIFLQNLVVGLISLIPGLIIILVVNDFAMISLYAAGISLLLVVLLSVLVVIYPSVLIYRMNPAELLKEE